MLDRPCDPPRPVQYRTVTGDWADGILIGWRQDRLRGKLAVVIVELPAPDVREGAAAHRPDGHNSMARRGWKGPLPYRT